jgi:ribosomal protein L11 methyltransferase
MRELVHVTGEGFGPGGHPTTAMCLAALDDLPDAPAVDVGCGSGLLAQAWARRWAVHVLAIDLDPAAIAQTRGSSELAGCGHLVEARRQPVTALRPDELAARIVFANVPLPAHHTLVARFDDPPLAVVLSGLRPAEAPVIVAAYRHMGLRHVRAARRGRFECHVLAAAR